LKIDMEEIMKKSALGVVLVSTLLAAAAVRAATSHFAVGDVKSVDSSAGTATIAHQPVESLKWPSMTMEFKVSDPATLERLPKGGRVAFEFTGSDGDWRVVNAIPIAQTSGGGGEGHQGMHGGKGGGMMGGMAKMHEECMDMMRRK
jgi:Cu/Ag efflux protein CusF